MIASIFVLAIVGGVAGYALATIGNGDTPVSRSFTKTGGYATWRALVAVNFGVWFAFTPIMARWLIAVRRLGTGSPIRWVPLAVGYLAGVGAILLILLVAGGPSSPLSHQWGRVLGITLTGLLSVGLLGAIGLLAIWQRGSSHRVDRPPTADDVNTLFELRRYGTRFLATLGGVIGLALIATGQLRSAVVAFDETRAMPATAVLYFGALYTAFLAALYGPARSAVESMGKVILDTAAPLPNKLCGDYLAAMEARTTLAEKLDLGGDFREIFENGVLIAAPLISGLISFAIGA